MDNPLGTQDTGRRQKKQQCCVFFLFYVPNGLSIIAFSFSFVQHLFHNSLQLEFDMKCVLQML